MLNLTQDQWVKRCYDEKRAHEARIKAIETAPCDCAAYSFPHRPGSGSCHRDPDNMSADYCAECGCSDTSMQDHGIGPYEFWGATGCDTDVQLTCDWCEGTDIVEATP